MRVLKLRNSSLIPFRFAIPLGFSYSYSALAVLVLLLEDTATSTRGTHSAQLQNMRVNEPPNGVEPETKSAGVPPWRPPKVAGGMDDLPPGQQGPRFSNPDHPPNIYVWLLRFLGFLMFAVAWGGHRFMQGAWPGSFKLALCTTMGFVALWHTLFASSRCRSAGMSRTESDGPLGLDRPLVWIDVILVTALVIASGAFLTWLFHGSPPMSR